MAETAPSSGKGSGNPLLERPILPLLVRFSIPNIIALLAAALATVSETSYVGRIGTEALAGMALVFPFVMLQNMFSAGAMGGGISSAISRALGGGQVDRANALAVHALLIGVIAGIVYMALMLVGGRVLFGALGGRGSVLAQALAYAEIAFLGSIFLWMVNTLSSVLRGTGNMVVPSVTLLVISVMQVVAAGALGLGWWGLPALGMRGVAAGQVFAYAAGALALWFYVRSGRTRIRLQLRATPLQGDMAADILRVGAVACLSPLQTVATILILTRLVAEFGTEALAGYGIGSRLEFLLVPIAFAVGVAAVPLVGTAIGAGQVARARRVAWTAAGIATLLLGAIGLVVTLFPDAWTRLFTQDARILAATATYFRWVGPCYGLFGLGLCLYFASLGAGKPLGPVLAGTLRLVMVAVGGVLLAQVAAPEWAIFALVGGAMVAYGLSTALFVGVTPWGAKAAPQGRG